MFSRFAIRSLRAAPVTPRTFSLLATRPASVVARPSTLLFARSYAGGHGPDLSLTKENIERRILDIFRTFDKVNQDKLNLDSSFTEDLGLDSLDAVEVIMAIEEDFFIEIPDAEADEIRTVRQAVDYIINTPEAGLH
ncbi:Acyl carrier protein [Phaffia rhodozyma]|uniref:Acyl carrier protein n=1 Tax=Phaffia rhodozyma TaxID=264483 RepID=A0A0F7SHM8_PHARH|nr:Acyl carrier protein [Phaffia rhodozyma]